MAVRPGYGAVGPLRCRDRAGRREHVGRRRRPGARRIAVHQAPGLAGRRAAPLGGIDDEALADERVEGGLGHLGEGGLAHDVPDQQPVVGPHGEMVVVVHPDRALQPPVGRVQPVRVVAARGGQARRGQLRGQLGPGEDPHMSPGDLVVLTRQGPADPLREPGWHGHRDGATGAHDPGDLGQRGGVGGHVLEDLGRDDGVERPVGEGQPGGVGGDGARPAAAPATGTASPAARIAPNIAVTGGSSPWSRSAAITRAPRR